MDNLELFGEPELPDQEAAEAPAAPDVPDAPADGPAADPTDEPPVWTVSQVNRAVRTLLESRIPTFWITGEVGQWTRARSGHCYFTLRDEQAQLRAVMWRTDALRLPMDPEDGSRIRAFGSLTLYEARGEYQMRVLRITAEDGEGLWRVALERLRARLDAEGLLAPERKRPLPPLPRAVGIVTSTEGAALRDMLRGLRERCPWVRVVVRNARVQGEGAARALAAGVRALGGSGLVDVLILGRGGGSQEDLWAFNEEPVARAVAACPVPVVSAVGHEVDVTITDLVADVRAPTPTAAAALVSLDRSAMDGALDGRLARVRQALVGRVERPARRLEALSDRIPELLGRELERRRAALARVSSRVEALSPLGALGRGFAVPLDPTTGRVVRTVRDFTAGAAFHLRVVDGRVDARAETLHADPGAEPST